MTHAHERAAAQQADMMITRVFKAPRPLVYKLWTDPKYVALWWGIEAATNPVCEMDVRPGGRWRIDMRTSGGTVYPNEFEFLEVVENKRLVYGDLPQVQAPDRKGDSLSRTAIHTVTFDDEGSGTRVCLETCFASEAERDRVLKTGIKEGIGQSFDRFERLLDDLKAGAVRTPSSGSEI